MQRLYPDDAKKILLDMLRCFAKSCDELEIPYAIDAGTLLGSCRGGLFIPHDHDVDVVVFDVINFLEVVNKMGNMGFGYNRDGVLDYQCVKFAPYNWDDSRTDCLKPTMDVFLFRCEGGKVEPFGAAARNDWPTWWYLEENMFPLGEHKFEGMSLKGPKNPEEYLERMYGDWKTVDRTFGPKDNIDVNR